MNGISEFYNVCVRLTVCMRFEYQIHIMKFLIMALYSSAIEVHLQKCMHLVACLLHVVKLVILTVLIMKSTQVITFASNDNRD